MSVTLFWYFETDVKAHVKHCASPLPLPSSTHTQRLSQGEALVHCLRTELAGLFLWSRHFYLKGQAVIIEIWLFCIWKIISCRLMQWACHFQNNKWQHFHHWVFRWKSAVWENLYLLLRADSFPECKWFLMRSMSINECVLRYYTMRCVNIWKIVTQWTVFSQGLMQDVTKITHK